EYFRIKQPDVLYKDLNVGVRCQVTELFFSEEIAIERGHPIAAVDQLTTQRNPDVAACARDNNALHDWLNPFVTFSLRKPLPLDAVDSIVYGKLQSHIARAL